VDRAAPGGTCTDPVIDTHCHLLWRVDDGPRSAMDAIDLARVLVVQGINAAICTPHYSARFPTSVEAAKARFEELTHDLAELDVPLRLALAAEVHFRLALSVPLDELRARSVGGFVLVEVDAETAADVPAHVVERLGEAGLRPVFAHPERSPALSEDPALLEEARAAGALVQVVGASLLGRRGSAASEAGWALLEEGRADLLASDAHGAAGTAAGIRGLVDVAAQRLGRAAVDDLTRRNPAKLFG
jgi:protein-tyrosine phosphatase